MTNNAALMLYLQQEAQDGEEHQQAVRLAAGAGEGGVEAIALAVGAPVARPAQRALVPRRALRLLVGPARHGEPRVSLGACSLVGSRSKVTARNHNGPLVGGFVRQHRM
jgi:hypothetical protein